MKILSPAGTFESLKMAVYNGADEVYLGINDFNARNNIDGFNLENLENAVDFAHVFGVKVCLAINILFTNEEIERALDTVLKAYSFGVDYFIVQDLGLINLLHDNYPEIQLHASTQMGIHNLEGVKYIEKFGVKRVVLARETPLSEIKRIRDNSNIEIEYFVQGALCVSFSGNCYLSSYLLNESGNRGRCKQLCRQHYTLKHNDRKLKSGYLLSAKDFNMSKRLHELKNAGVDVIKIEGRARRPSYVGMVTKEYFNALHKNSINQQNISLAFNREFTAGYFDGNSNVISKFNNHIGIEVGKVEKVKVGKKFNEILISSCIELSPKSTFKFFDKDIEKNTLTAYDLTKISNGKYMITTTQIVNAGNTVRMIIDEKMENEIFKTLKKRDLEISISAKVNQSISATVNIDGESVVIKGDILLPSDNRPLTKAELEENFIKSEFFSPKLCVKDLESVFIAKSRLNEFRRKVYSEIYNIIVQKSKKVVEKKSARILSNAAFKPLTDFEIVDCNYESATRKNVIYSPETYDLKDVQNFISVCEKTGKTPILDTPNFALKEDIELIKRIVNETGIKIVANNYYALELGVEIIVGAGLNVYNEITASVFDKEFLVAESSVVDKVDFPYMTLRHCPIKEHVGGNCDKCKYDKNYFYVMDNGKALKLKRKKLTTCTFYLTD